MVYIECIGGIVDSDQSKEYVKRAHQKSMSNEYFERCLEKRITGCDDDQR